MRISKISNIVTTITKKTSKVSTKKSMTAQATLPLVSIPIVAYSLQGYRDRNLTEYNTQAINKLKKQLNDGKITQKEYNSRANEINNYYNDAKNLPSKISSSQIKQKEPTFKGDDTDCNIHNENDNMVSIDPNDPDLMMDPRLEEIYNAPEVNTPEGLLENIFRELPDGFNMDMNLLDTLKGLAKDVFKEVFGDLLG